MTSERVLRFEVPGRVVLDRLVSGPLPLELRGGEVEADFFRDLYFDTPEGDLERRGATVRLRIRKDGSRVFSVDVREREGDAVQVVRSHSQEEVREEDFPRMFAGSSEPAQLLRAMIDPDRLEVQIELEVMRRVRSAHPEGQPEAVLELACDAVTVRRGETSAEFQELEVRLPADVPSGPEGLVQALEAEYGVRVTLAGSLGRAREVLESLELEVLEREIRAAREVAVLAYEDGRIALRRDEGALRVPAGQGWGEEACRQVLRSCFGRSQAQVRLLGTRSGLGTRPGIEVWLAQNVRRDQGEENSPELVWIPLEEALEKVGSPELRDVHTLAALHAAARASLPAARGRTWDGRTAPTGKHPFKAKRETTATHPTSSVPTPTVPDGDAKALPPEVLLNPELSELAFHERVLVLAEDPRIPLLERVFFLSIVGSNLDEFFMTRVAGYAQQVASGSTKPTLDGLTPEEQVDAMAIRARQLLDRAYEFLGDELLPALRAHEIDILCWDDLDEGDRDYLYDNYAVHLDALLTPLAADPSHPFPHIRNLRPALAVIVRVPESRVEHFAAIELPGDLPRFVPLPGGRRFIPLEEVIRASLPDLYTGLEVVRAHTFRVTRSANFSLDEDSVSDVLQAVEEEVAKRPLGPVVRLEVESSMPAEMCELLLRELQFEARQRVSTLSEENVYTVERLVDLAALREIAALPVDELHYPPLEREVPIDPARSTFETLREREVLVQFPRDSFEASVERLLAEAADDPDVVAIKITLYRTNRSSEVVRMLRRARKKGKQVVALVELKASFDEQRNIEWARSLESSGIHVVYGPPKLKVHAKIALIVRREDDALQRYVYIGTGNLNAATAASYTDLGLLSTDPELGEELNDVFNGLTGYSIRTDYEHLLVAPFNMRPRFLELVRRETEHARAGRGGHIRVKMNGLTDREIIAALYEASQAGVRVELIVRGICALRPGVEGLSQNIRVTSVLGRFLEHSRIYRFENAGEPEYFIGSADWRPRNLVRRVEVVVSIRNHDHRAELDRIMESNLSNPERWALAPDGTYVQPAVDGS